MNKARHQNTSSNISFANPVSHWGEGEEREREQKRERLNHVAIQLMVKIHFVSLHHHYFLCMCGGEAY